MLRGGIPIGKAFGIPLRLHWSWFIIFALVTWGLTTSYFPAIYANWNITTIIATGLLTSLLFFISVLVHELMHSVVAVRQGIHIEGITLFILGGVSQMTEEPKTAKDEFRMAIAGPGSSLILGGICWVIWIASRDSDIGALQFISAISYWLGYINLALGIFNLIPGFPLDGGRVLRSLMWWRGVNLQKSTKIASNIGRGIGYLLILGGVYLIFTGDWINGIWLPLIGWFLESSAAGSYRQLLIQDMLNGHVASEIMSRDCQIVPADLTIERLINENILTSGRRCFPVVSEGKVQGLITIRDIKSVSREQWSYKLVRDTMTPMNRIKSVRPDADLNSVLNLLSQNDINQLLVVEDDKFIGIVARDNIINFINIRAQLNKP